MENIKIDPEFQMLIAPISEDEYMILEKSILAEGCRDKLVLWGNTLVDGHNRYEICQKNSISFETTQKSFANRTECKLWIIDNQLGRRNLSPQKRILLAKQKQGILKEMARTNQREAGGDRKSEHYKTIVSLQDYRSRQTAVIQPDNSDLSPEQEETEIIDDPLQRCELVIQKHTKGAVHVQQELAKIANVGTGTLARYEQIEKKKPELLEKVHKDEMTINGAYEAIKAEEEKKKQETAIQEQRKCHKVTNHIDIYSTEKKYRVIYADPPWSDIGEQNVETPKSEEKQKPILSLNDICDLPVPAEDNAVLFLWVPSLFLEDCFKVISAWGFTYKYSYVWDTVDTMGKELFGDVRHMFLLIGIKGDCKPDCFFPFDSVQSIARTDLNHKPKEFRQIISGLYPTGMRLEMFARDDSEGWDVWNV